MPWYVLYLLQVGIKIVLVTSMLNTNRLLPGSSDFMTILNMLLILGKYNMAL